MTQGNSDRIKELETKSIFQEDAMERLSDEVRLQQIEIIKLKDDLEQLMEILKESSSNNTKTSEKPPHY
jgi:uncharacterized coiled-coil protein SlyX